ncbi:hypothetical protein BH10BAC6_BH10BAC6_09030 [soil metagenome]
MKKLLVVFLALVAIVAQAGVDLRPRAPYGFIPNKGQWSANIQYGAWTSGGIVWIVKDGFILDRRGANKDGVITSTIEEHHFADITGAVRFSEVVPPNAPTIQFLTKRTFIQHESLRPRSIVNFVDPITGVYLSFEVLPNGSVSMSSGHITSVIGMPTSLGIDHEPVPLDRVTLASAIRGVSDEEITGTVIAADGNVVVCGWTTTMNLVVPTGGQTATAKAGEDGFVAIYSSDLSHITSWTYVSGSADDRALAVCLGATGTICVAGETNSADIPMASGSSGQLYSAGIDGFFLRFSADLRQLVAGRYINGDRDEHVRAMTADASGAIYLCGSTNSAKGFDVTNGYDVTYNGSTDAFLLKITAAAANIAYSTYYGGGGVDEFNAIHVNASGQVTVVGSTASSDFETIPTIDPLLWWLYTERPYDWTYNGGAHDAIAVRFRPDGGGVVFATFFGGSGDDVGKAVCVDAKDQTYVVGETNSEDLPMVTSLQAQINGSSDVFVSVLDGIGKTLVRSTYYGGESVETVSAASFISGDQFMITGTTKSSRLPLSGLGSVSELKGGQDCFLTLMTTSSIVYGTLIGWTSSETPLAFARDAEGDIYIGGSTTSSVNGPYGGGKSDAFLVKWIFGLVSTAQPHGGETNCLGRSMQISWNPQEMPINQKYDVDFSADNGRTWMSIARGVSGKSMNWTPDDVKYLSKTCLVRVTTLRGHSAVMEVPFRIVGLPAIVDQPMSVERCYGASAQLVVGVDGEDVSYQWRMNGIAIRGAIDPVLNFANISASDVGPYDVVVNGACNSSLVSAAAMVAIAPVTLIMSDPISTQVRVGEKLVLNVNAQGASLSYQWRRNGAVIAAPVGTAKSITFEKALPEDAGRYDCIVMGSCGIDTSSVAIVDVLPVVSSVEWTEDPTFRVSPNPASSSVTIHVNEAKTLQSVSVLSLLGTTLFEQTIKEGEMINQDVVIDLSSIPSGAYTVVARWSDHRSSVPILIAR